MNQILLHIPHSSTKLPKMFWKDICVDKEVVNKFIYDITDTNTDKLFGNNKFDQILFSYSRVFCDVEKFVDDKQEIMSKFGMGVIYTKTNDGVLFRNIKEDTKKYILENYYYPYHKKFENIVQKMLNKNESVIIVDCHSFSKDIIVFADKKKDLPDICIGINNENKLSNFIYGYFKELKYKVKINYPYTGSIVPNKFINNSNSKLFSIMLEINKELYVGNKDKFIKLQNEINELLKILKHINFS